VKEKPPKNKSQEDVCILLFFGFFEKVYCIMGDKKRRKKKNKRKTKACIYEENHYKNENSRKQTFDQYKIVYSLGRSREDIYISKCIYCFFTHKIKDNTFNIIFFFFLPLLFSPAIHVFVVVSVHILILGKKKIEKKRMVQIYI